MTAPTRRRRRAVGSARVVSVEDAEALAPVAARVNVDLQLHARLAERVPDAGAVLVGSTSASARTRPTCSPGCGRSPTGLRSWRSNALQSSYSTAPQRLATQLARTNAQNAAIDQSLEHDLADDRLKKGRNNLRGFG